MKKIISIFLFLMIPIASFPGPKMTESIPQWEVFTVSFKTGKVYQNPYAEIPVDGTGDLIKVLFTGITGDAAGKTFTIKGYWNGGQEWRVNFSAPFSGKWKYESFSSDKSLNGKKGNLEVNAWTEEEKKSNPVRHGFV